MKKTLVILMATSLFAAAVPVLAEEAHQHGATSRTENEQIAKECDMLLKNCAQEVDSIQERITKLKAAISNKGADKYTVEELKILNKKLNEANETLRSLTKPGR
ncbi:MAG: hypothetical protein WA003_06770 [Desulfuromonadaceae bacterium]